MTFPYDWRKSLRRSTEAFRDRVRDCRDQNGGPVHVVAHSMGGLLVRAALMTHGAELWPLIDRIVFVGTPHYGSPAIASYLKNHLWGFDILAGARHPVEPRQLSFVLGRRRHAAGPGWRLPWNAPRRSIAGRRHDLGGPPVRELRHVQRERMGP